MTGSCVCIGVNKTVPVSGPVFVDEQFASLGFEGGAVWHLTEVCSPACSLRHDGEFLQTVGAGHKGLHPWSRTKNS